MCDYRVRSLIDNAQRYIWSNLYCVICNTWYTCILQITDCMLNLLHCIVDVPSDPPHDGKRRPMVPCQVWIGLAANQPSERLKTPTCTDCKCLARRSNRVTSSQFLADINIVNASLGLLKETARIGILSSPPGVATPANTSIYRYMRRKSPPSFNRLLLFRLHSVNCPLDTARSTNPNPSISNAVHQA